MASRSTARAEAAARRRAEAAEGIPAKLSPAGRMRLIARVAMLVGAVLLFVPLHYLFRLFRLPSPWPRHFLGTADGSAARGSSGSARRSSATSSISPTI
jgi:hypothetical protein